MNESLPYSIGKLEPGGPADEFVRAVLPAVVKLAELIEQISWSVERIDALEQKLDETNKLLDNMLKVLSSGSGAV